jgi:glucose/arabinose dehydrogenase
MRRGTLLFLLMAVGTLAGCGDATDPDSPDPGGPPTVRGTERLGWDQEAASTEELATLRYAIYVDGVRSVMAGVDCDRTLGTAGYPCSGRLPTMTSGVHILELAAFVMDGNRVLESPKSAPFQVMFSPALGAPAGPASPDPPEPPSPPVADDDNRFERLLEGEAFDDINDAALTPDGWLLVAERAGVLRAANLHEGRPSIALSIDGTRAAGDAGSLLSVAVHPEFERSRIIFVLQTARSRDGRLTYQLARYRQAGDFFGERAVLMETGTVRGARPSGTVRVGPDSTLYVATTEAGGPVRRGSGAEAEGRILRLNFDGTTPRDQLSASPVLAVADGEARGLDWNPATGELWAAYDRRLGAPRVFAVASDRRRARTGAEQAYALPSASGVASISFYRGEQVSSLQGTLLIAAENGLYRARFDLQNRSRIVSVDPYMEVPVRAIIAAPDGELFLAVANAVLRVVPQ